MQKALGFLAVALIFIVEATNPSWQVILISSIVICSIGSASLALRRATERSRQTNADRGASDVLTQLRAGKTPKFCLYLRPFWITNKVSFSNPRYSPEVLSPRRYSEPSSREFEALLAETFGQSWPLIALGRPGEAVGAGRVLTDDVDDVWKSDFRLLAKSAMRIFVVPSSRPGSRWEIEFLKNNRLLQKCVLMMPPGLNIQQEWDELRKTHIIEMPIYSLRGGLFTLREDGSLAESGPLHLASSAALAAAVGSVDCGRYQIAGDAPPLQTVTTDVPAVSTSSRSDQPMSAGLKFLLVFIAALAAGYVVNFLKLLLGD